MGQVNIELNDYVNAKDGSLLIKKNGKWQTTNFDELNKENESRIDHFDKALVEFEAFKKNAKHFVVYSKSHFLVVFNYFKIKIISGELDVVDEEILKLDEAVLNEEISVEEAIEKHEFLKEVYTKLYLKEKEYKEFPEV